MATLPDRHRSVSGSPAAYDRMTGLAPVARAAELATSPVICVEAEVDALAALRTMHANQIRHLPILAGGECVGLVSETDLLIGMLSRTRGPLPTSGELCRRPAPVVDERASRAEVAELMREHSTDALVVCSGRRMVGVLSAVDLVRSLAMERNSAIAD